MRRNEYRVKLSLDSLEDNPIMEVMLAALVLLALYLLDEGRMRQVGASLKDFLEYLERQQG